MYIIYQKYESKRVPHKIKANQLICAYFKNHRIPCFRSGDVSNYVTVPPIQVGQFMHLTSLVNSQCPTMHCLYANAVVQPSVQHCPCYMV